MTKLKLNANRLATFALGNLPYTMVGEVDPGSNLRVIIDALAAGIVQEVEAAQEESEAAARTCKQCGVSLGNDRQANELGFCSGTCKREHERGPVWSFLDTRARKPDEKLEYVHVGLGHAHEPTYEEKCVAAKQPIGLFATMAPPDTWATPQNFVNDPFIEAVRSGFNDEPYHVRRRHQLFSRAHRSFDVKDLDLFK